MRLGGVQLPREETRHRAGGSQRSPSIVQRRDAKDVYQCFLESLLPIIVSWPGTTYDHWNGYA